MSSPFNEEKYKRLLEGLEISEVSFKSVIDENDWHRLDPEYYKKYATKIINLIKSGRFVTIGDCFDVSKLAGFEFTEYFTSEHMNSKDSYIALTSKNIQSERLELTDYITIDRKVADAYLQRSKIIKGDVILSYTGEYRRALVMQDENHYQLGPNICRIRSKSSIISPYYLSTFLNSSIGQTILDKEKTLSAQPTVAMSRIRQIPIPVLNNQSLIDELIKQAYLNIENSKSIYKEVEQVLLEELGLKGWQPNNAPFNIKQLKESYLASGRLDAEYYQPKYEDYAFFIRKYKGGADSLGKVCTLNEKNFNPIETHEYKYIELSNIGNSGEITSCTTSIGAELPSRARRLVRANDVIVSSIEGSLQSVALVTDEYDKAICSTGFYVVKSETINPETLLVLFKSEPMQNLLKQGCSGTILTAIGRNELQNIVMPKIRNEVQTEIAAYVQKSISLRNEAKQLLESAKLKVEDAISTPPI